MVARTMGRGRKVAACPMGNRWARIDQYVVDRQVQKKLILGKVVATLALVALHGTTVRSWLSGL